MIGYKIFCTKESYLVYKEMCAEVNMTPIKHLIYNKITADFMQFLMDKLFEGHDIALPPNLGTLAIRCRKVVPRLDRHGNPCGVAPSWSKTKILWTEKATEMGLTFKEYIAQVPKEQRNLVYCFNEHTNGLKYGLMWYKKTAIFRNKLLYNLVFCRAAKRRLYREILAGAEYTEINPKISRRAVYKKEEVKITDD